MLDISKRLFLYWNTSDVVYCHWKSNEHLVPGLDGETDLDVLMDLSSKEKGCKILGELSFLPCKSQFGSRYPNVEDWIGFDASTGKQIHVHLHYALVTGHKGLKEYSLPWCQMTLDTRVQDLGSGVFIMEPNLEIVTLFTRIGLKCNAKQYFKAHLGKYALSEDIKKEIDWLKERVNKDSVKNIAETFFKHNPQQLCSLIFADNYDSAWLIRLENVVTSNMRTYRRFGLVVNSVLRVYYRGALVIRNRYKNAWNLITRKCPSAGNGLVIAFIGQDGSGKSTVTQDIRKWLSWKLEAKRFYLGSGEHYNPWEKKIQERLDDKHNPLLKMVKKILSFRLVKKIADLSYKNIRRAFKYADKGGIALLDRYPQTEYPSINDGPKLRTSVLPKVQSAVARKLVMWYADREERTLQKATAYQPDVVFKLMLSPEESIRRKPFENYEGVKRKHEIIKSLRFPGSTVYEIDATQDYEQEIIQIKNIIWQHILKS